ncbi:carbon-nitrogen hydrolase family protein [uncultured Litoreibacter sp.]|uniref:carbon-nitrogen hydrolase family protein n=1 Tax=uncultured Litoreibacter sp. TaxID=1392394 RepID=UPI00260ED043|nr:carbon-nitrogen hydrolase family protein [uncultured Litoreibacter sp.]
MRIGLVQLNSSDDPAANLVQMRRDIGTAVEGGAEFVLTPEVSNCVSLSRSHQNDVLHLEADDPTLAGLRDIAQQHSIWLLAGSLGMKTGDADGRFANRSLMIGPDGQVAGRYDKIHMFDVQVTETETFKESDGYRPGADTAVVQTGFGKVGLTICYDIRFPHLHRALAKAGAQIITVPAAFSPVTGAAHWHVLLRARAIETGCFIIAPAQTGQHNGRATYGHSLVVAPWGEVLLDMGEEPGVACLDIDLAEVGKARQRVPSLSHDRKYSAPILRGDERTE